MDQSAGEENSAFTQRNGEGSLDSGPEIVCTYCNVGVNNVLAKNFSPYFLLR